ncbi:anti-sigma B factor antagonist [Rubricella aquisinus]|uniref:Anti-sigma factor antagonist n=1 Tax=Rubricella aquisinus TaxID=2028108 RepID=A0A840WPT2_9RHOB|nr:STAS domain-containing protein [Rubricella aquisinus]MBB5517049.1 anti-sigma B factor antagonist [Rubricella aquisinus]
MIKITQMENGITTVRPGVERLVASNAKTFKDELIELVGSGSALIVLDFDGVSFVDSSGLGALVGVLKRIGNRGELVVSGLNADVAQLFRICRMDRVFKSYSSADAAVQAMGDRL